MSPVYETALCEVMQCNHFKTLSSNKAAIPVTLLLFLPQQLYRYRQNLLHKPIKWGKKCEALSYNAPTDISKTCPAWLFIIFVKGPIRDAHLANMKHPAVTAHLTEAWKEEALCNILPHHGCHFANNLFLNISVKRKALTNASKE